jgi:hypothetical protein
MLCSAHLECSSGFSQEQDATTGKNRESYSLLVRLCSNITALHGEVPKPSRHSMQPAIDQGGSAARRRRPNKYGFFLTASHIKSRHASWLVHSSIRHFHPLSPLPLTLLFPFPRFRSIHSPFPRPTSSLSGLKKSRKLKRELQKKMRVV